MASPSVPAFVSTRMARFSPRFDVAPHRLSGTVIVALLNHRDALASLGDAVAAAPYKAAPTSVVLAIKPRHALVDAGDALLVDDADMELEISAALGVVIGRTACAVAEHDALSHVAGYLAVVDATLPRTSHYRPQIRAMARDASCAMGAVVAAATVGDPDALTLTTFVDGRPAATSSTADHVRSVARLLAEISDFMTLTPGDVLVVGGAPNAPRVRAGALIAVEIGGVGRLETRVAVGERSAA